MYNEQLQVLKKIKLELKFCSDRTNELNMQIVLRHSIMHTKKSGKLSKGLRAQINDMESDVKPVDSLFKTDKSTLQPIESACANIKIEKCLQPLKKKNHQCALCKKEFMDKCSFTDHLEYHTGTTFPCEKCPSRRFSSSKSLKNHMQFHKRGDVYLVCSICQKQFELTSQLTLHRKSHAPPALHYRVHENCTKGPYTFEDQRLHHECYYGKPKRYQCDTCEHLYTSPDLLRQHHLRDGHTGQRIFAEEDTAPKGQA